MEVRLICDATSPALEVDGKTEVRFHCQKPEGHRGDHRITLEWPTDPALFGLHPWAHEA